MPALETLDVFSKRDKISTIKFQNQQKSDIVPVKALIDLDPWLTPYRGTLQYRYDLYSNWVKKINESEGGLDKFSLSYQKYGFNYSPEEKGIWYREWAPGAKQAYLIGDFNDWNRDSHPMQRDSFGLHSIFLPDVNGVPAIPHNSKVKISMITECGERIERVPAWIKRVVQDLSKSPNYDAVFWNPPNPYKWKNPIPMEQPYGVRIYESHVGICTPEGKVASYKDFTTQVLPRIRDLGYNCIQLMAIMEHPYYASFGYQVTSFFAPSSRYGTPEELKELVDTAHGYGLYVLLDVVHSHACKNVLDGLNMFDGTDHHFFHSGGKGNHDLWDSRLFNYGNHETLRFLLSNLRYWICEYNFDGFRFDGVTSMMYLHHGIGTGFSGHYDEYFSDRTDLEAVGYLMLANDMIHSVRPNLITIAEDVSGMPTLCRPVQEGGVGFDYRLAMAIPDMWIKILKELKDDDWDMNFITWTLINRRHAEKAITYAESHDQALVGDKTLAFWLMDKEMYDFMSDVAPMTPIIERGLALHKMIRLITYGLGGEGYLNFMGNEFGHPEWLDFPRAGNNNSYHYARRQYNLVDDSLLRYKYLYAWDSAMQHLESEYHWLESHQAYVSLKHGIDKVVAFERGDLLWVFNFHPSKSFDNYRVGTPWNTRHKCILSSDDSEFAGHNRVNKNIDHFASNEWWCDRPHFIQIYIPCRTCLVFKHD